MLTYSKYIRTVVGAKPFSASSLFSALKMAYRDLVPCRVHNAALSTLSHDKWGSQVCAGIVWQGAALSRDPDSLYALHLVVHSEP